MVTIDRAKRRATRPRTSSELVGPRRGGGAGHYYIKINRRESRREVRKIRKVGKPETKSRKRGEKMVISLGLTSKACGPIYSNSSRCMNSNGISQYAVACSHLLWQSIQVKVSFAQNVRMALRCSLQDKNLMAHCSRWSDSKH